MKKIVLILFISLACQLFAQDYKPLLDTSNEWHLRYCFSGNCSTDIYYTNGDTLVDGINFKVLDGYHYISRGFLLREDVNEKKVYLKTILPTGIRDYLLYDFSLAIGDSIDIKNPVTPFPQDAGYYTVNAIENLPLVDGNEYRHFYLSPSTSNTVSTNDAIWVEGVGSLSLINAPSGIPDVNEAGRVGCMFKNGISYYADLTIVDSCEATILAAQDTSFDTTKIKVIKKATLNAFKIINLNEVNGIELYTLNGKKLKSFELQNKNSLDLDISSFQAGMYVIVAKYPDKQSSTLKVIVE